MVHVFTLTLKASGTLFMILFPEVALILPNTMFGQDNPARAGVSALPHGTVVNALARFGSGMVVGPIKPVAPHCRSAAFTSCGDNPDRMDEAGNVAEDRERDIQPEMAADPDLQKHAERR